MSGGSTGQDRTKLALHLLEASYLSVGKCSSNARRVKHETMVPDEGHTEIRRLASERIMETILKREGCSTQ